MAETGARSLSRRLAQPGNAGNADRIGSVRIRLHGWFRGEVALEGPEDVPGRQGIIPLDLPTLIVSLPAAWAFRSIDVLPANARESAAEDLRMNSRRLSRPRSIRSRASSTFGWRLSFASDFLIATYLPVSLHTGNHVP